MADIDQNTSLPVRTQADGTDERLHVKIVDGVTSPAVNQTEVDADNNLHTEIHGNDPSAADQVVRLSELGAVTPDGVYDVTNNTKPGNVGVIAHTRSGSPGDATQTERITSVTHVGTNVKALDVSLHDEAGAAYSTANPLPVFVSETEGGAGIHDFYDNPNVAVGSTVNHDYTVNAAKTLKFWQIVVAASGKIKVELYVDLGAGLVRQAVYFNSTANTNVDCTFKIPFTVAATLKVRLAVTNRDNQPQDIYSLIVGVEN